MGTIKRNHDTVRLVPSLLLLCSIGLAIAAVFSPWFHWNQYTRMTADGRWLMTTNLNYLLPTIAVGTSDAIGAQTIDGNRALVVGQLARLIVLGLSVSIFWLLIRKRPRRHQILIALCVLPILLGAFAYVALDNWMIDQVILADEATLPSMAGLEWLGPGLLIAALFVYALAWRIRTKAA